MIGQFDGLELQTAGISGAPLWSKKVTIVRAIGLYHEKEMPEAIDALEAALKK
jgi:hypothetical protein